MRIKSVQLASVSLGMWLSGCLLSDFDRVERAERARNADSVVIGSDMADPSTSGRGGVSVPSAGRVATAGRGAAGMIAAEAGRGGSAGESAAGASGALPVAGKSAAGVGGAADGGGASAGTGAGAHAAAGSAGADAGSAGAAGTTTPSCGDTTKDPEHCGGCDHACGAVSGALASCVDSQCVFACNAGVGDCNADLHLGMAGDGCETQFTAGVRYEPANGCVRSQLEVGEASVAGGYHGDAYPGTTYRQLCGDGTALVGLDFRADEWCMSSVEPLCAAVTFEGTPGSFALTTGQPQALMPLSGDGPAKRLVCSQGAVVTAVSGGIWHDMDNAGPCVRQLALTCSQLVITGPFQVGFNPAGTLRDGAVLESQEAFTDTCPSGQVVVGFSGQFDGYVDGISTLCATLSAGQPFGSNAAQP